MDDIIDVVSRLNEDLWETGLDEELTLSVSTSGFAWIIDFNGLVLLDSETIDYEEGNIRSQIICNLVELSSGIGASVMKLGKGISS